MADLLAAEQCTAPRLWPLSLLALQALLRRLCISRQPTQFDYNHVCGEISKWNRFELQIFLCFQNVVDVNNNLSNKLQTILMKKNIKEKKRHEIEKMSQLTARIAKDCDVQYIVDFGAGLGHLARALAFNYGAKVCCLEQQLALTEQAMWVRFSISIHTHHNFLCQIIGFSTKNSDGNWEKTQGFSLSAHAIWIFVWKETPIWRNWYRLARSHHQYGDGCVDWYICFSRKSKNVWMLPTLPAFDLV